MIVIITSRDFFFYLSPLAVFVAAAADMMAIFLQRRLKKKKLHQELRSALGDGGWVICTRTRVVLIDSPCCFLFFGCLLPVPRTNKRKKIKKINEPSSTNTRFNAVTFGR